MRMRATTFFLIVAFIFSVCTIGMSTYVYVAIDSLRSNSAQEPDDLAKENDHQIQILKIKKQLADLVAERAELDQYFFRESEEIQLIERLEDLAKHAGVDLTVSGASSVDSPVSAFRVGFTMQGTWPHLMYFLSLLESLPTKLAVTQVTLRGAAGQEWSGTASFDLMGFIQDQPAQ